MGVCVTPLKTYRHDLAAHLADGLHITPTPLGGQVNPPTVIVQPSSTYITAVDYQADGVAFDVAVLTKPGDLAAEMDALDDLVDQIRATLRTVSPAGFRYGFREVSGRVNFNSDGRDLPAVVVTVIYERQNP